MIKPFADPARSVAADTPNWKTWSGLIIVPVLVMGLFTWALWSPDADHGTAAAAVVNLDDPVTINDKTVPLGRELAGDLTHSDDSAYEWVLTDKDDAADGLADGDYAAVVTIPKDFSAKATSSATAAPLDATKAVVTIKTTDDAGAADPALSESIAQTTQQTLNDQVVETYLDNVYVAFNDIHDQLEQAADGAGQLAEGTEELADGADSLADGTGELASGADDLAEGTGELASGADGLAEGTAEISSGIDGLAKGTAELAGGADGLAAGATELSAAALELSMGADALAMATAQLATGSAGLSNGLDEVETAADELPELTRQLADGAEQVAQGNEELADSVVPLANRIIEAIDDLPSAADAADEFQDLADRCTPLPGPGRFCEDLQETADQFSEDAVTIDDGVASIRRNIVETRDAVEALASGSQQVADGNDELADQMPSLASSITEAADGASELADGAEETDDGAQELASGAGQLAEGTVRADEGAVELAAAAGAVDDGAQALAEAEGALDAGAMELAEAAGEVDAGAEQLAEASGEVDEGAENLADGAEQVDDGAEDLASQLSDGADGVPTYTDDERDNLKTVAADPTTADIDATGTGELALPLFATMALWTLALAAYLVTRAVPAGIVTSRESTSHAIVRAAAPGAAAAGVAALAITAIAVPVLDLSASRGLRFLGVAVLAAVAFVALNQAAVAIFGRAGRLVSGAVLVLTAALGVVSTVPSPLYGIVGLLPTHGAVIALRGAAFGGSGMTTGVILLTVWLVVGALATIVITDRRRHLSPSQLRLARP
ncbi:YhgE/Pip family protein [Glycomyces rhizosphaerae]|uniref:YhgE/Pip family protein n=1 Tax=Glycomyces rhizosphaerae TaxID=2054422 RepID=A0ABV7Q0N5_9ACTN